MQHWIIRSGVSCSQKRLGSATQRQIGEELVADQGISVSRACRLLSLPRSCFYYRSCRDDRDVIAALQQLAEAHPAYGFRKLFAYLRRAGHRWNHKRVYRVYRLLLLNKRRKGKRRLPQRVQHPYNKQPQLIIAGVWTL